MSIDIDEMVRMAGEREGWRYAKVAVQLGGKVVDSYIVREDGDMVISAHDFEEDRDEIKQSHAQFVAQAPAAILHLSERIATLEAQNAALQARVGSTDQYKAELDRLHDNADELGDILEEIHDKILRGELDRKYWQGKKDGMRLCIAMLHPDKDLEGIWVGSLRTSHHADFLESEEKIMDRGEKARRERVSESIRQSRNR